MIGLFDSLIHPLQYCLDYRPFFTIHDPEFKEYTGRGPAENPPAVLLGVTNPFFAKALQHWPHIIRIGEVPFTGETRTSLPTVSITRFHIETAVQIWTCQYVVFVMEYFEDWE